MLLVTMKVLPLVRYQLLYKAEGIILNKTILCFSLDRIHWACLKTWIKRFLLQRQRYQEIIILRRLFWNQWRGGEGKKVLLVWLEHNRSGWEDSPTTAPNSLDTYYALCFSFLLLENSQIAWGQTKLHGKSNFVMIGKKLVGSTCMAELRPRQVKCATRCLLEVSVMKVEIKNISLPPGSNFLLGNPWNM